MARRAAADEVPAVMRGRSRGAVWARLLAGTFIDEGGTLEGSFGCESSLAVEG